MHGPAARPGRWQGRAWLSGFTGSVGTFIATADFAGVWTDGRYYTQAEQELAGTDIGGRSASGFSGSPT